MRETKKVEAEEPAEEESGDEDGEDDEETIEITNGDLINPTLEMLSPGDELSSDGNDNWIVDTTKTTSGGVIIRLKTLDESEADTLKGESTKRLDEVTSEEGKKYHRIDI